MAERTQPTEHREEQAPAPEAPEGPAEAGAPVGFLPAAGRGLRFGESGYAKELFPLLLETAPGLAAPEPRPICELALSAIRDAGAARCVVVLSPQRPQILQVLGAGEALGLPLGYVAQLEPRGLPHALRCARPFLAGHGVLFAMPDTVVLPRGALSEVHRLRIARGADVALAVLPVEEPERLGPVELGEDGEVLRVWDKPPAQSAPPRNSWALASWSPRFTDFCCAWDEEQERRGGGERVLGHAFEAARRAGLRLCGRYFEAGMFLDIGTPRGLRTALRALAAEGLISPEQAEPG